MIDSVARNGIVPVDVLYESPFTLRAACRPQGLFADAEVDDILAVLGGAVDGTAN